MVRRILILTTILAVGLLSPTNGLAGMPLETIQKQVNKVLDALREQGLRDGTARDAMEERILAIAEKIF